MDTIVNEWKTKVLLKLTMNNIIKYIIEGLAVAIAAYLIPRRKVVLQEIAIIGLMASLTFVILDVFAEDVGKGARFGTGFGIGSNLVGVGIPI